MARKTTKPKRDVYAEVTANIITAIESNPDKLEMPWHRSGLSLHLPSNVLSENSYNGINIVSLWATAEANGFESGIWGTYRQWKEKGAQVRKGEKSAPVIFYKEFDVEPSDGDDDGKRRVARASRVFNASQVDGYELPELPHIEPVERIARADQFLKATGAHILHGGDRAYYSPSTDQIRIPDEGRFIDTGSRSRTEGYYSVVLHELTHWTAIDKRCNRKLGKRFGDDAYAMEELVAELGAAFLCAELSITPGTRADHAQYIATWLNVLKADNKAIFAAAAKANEAVTYLKSLQIQREVAA